MTRTVKVDAVLHLVTSSEFTQLPLNPKSRPDELQAASRDMFNRVAFLLLFKNHRLGNFPIQFLFRPKCGNHPRFTAAHCRALPRVRSD